MHDWTLNDDVPFLERPDQYEGQERVSILMWSDARHRSERLAALDEWLQFLSVPRPIVELHLAGWTNDRMVAALGPQRNLRDLRITWGRYADLSPIGSLRTLKTLCLGGPSSVSNLRPLISLGRLRDLKIDAGPRLQDYSPLGTLTSLRHLEVGVASERPSTADSLDFLQHLTRLDSFSWMPSVATRDYSPLLALHGTDEIQLWEQRGMHPSMAELTEALPGLARTRPPDDEHDGDRGGSIWEFVDEDEVEDWDDGVLRGRVAGTVYRTFTRTARTRSEHFWMQLTSPVIEGDRRVPPAGERVLRQFEFAGNAEGPLLLWDTAIPDLTAAEVAEWFGGNVERWRPDGPAPERDATAMTPLPDEEFWPRLELFRGKFNGVMNYYRFDRELAAFGEEFVLRWTQTLAMHSLRGLPAAQTVVDSDRTLAGQVLCVLGAMIGGGADRFEQSISDPSSWKRPNDLDTASAVVHLGQDVLKEGRLGVQIITAFTPELQRIIDASEFDEVFHGEASLSGMPMLWTARAVVQVDDVLRERLVAFDVGDIGQAHLEVAAGAAMLAFGGSLIAGPELSAGGDVWLQRSQRMFTTRRRSSMPDEDYITRYAGT